MSYSVYPITSINDIPALVASFAGSLGFTVATIGATSVTVKHPTYTGARVFSVYVDNTGSGISLRERLAIGSDAPGSTIAWAESPKLNKTQVDSDAAVAVEAPTKLHLFGALAGGSADAGKSFVAGVIEYGYNLYRHFYLGYVEKITAFDGGEVISGSASWPLNDATTGVTNVAYDDSGAGSSSLNIGSVHPFSASVPSATNFRNGGCYVNHPSNLTPWRQFNYGGTYSTTIDNTFSTTGNSVVLGGYKDSINSGYLLAGKSPFAGVNILSPINLYIGNRVSGTQYFQAIGKPAGVRLVHMEDLEPGAEITVGTSVWRVFPVFAKSSDPFTRKTSTALSSGRRFPANNSSYYVGLAYLVSE